MRVRGSKGHPTTTSDHVTGGWWGILWLLATICHAKAELSLWRSINTRYLILSCESMLQPPCVHLAAHAQQTSRHRLAILAKADRSYRRTWHRGNWNIHRGNWNIHSSLHMLLPPGKQTHTHTHTLGIEGRCLSVRTTTRGRGLYTSTLPRASSISQLASPSACCT